MNASLVFLQGDLEGEDVELAGESLTIGRHPSRDLVFSADIVSRHHATIRHEGGSYVLRDEGSVNGTFVNNRKVKEQVLRDGDVIEFGLGGPSARFGTSDGEGVGVTAEVRAPVTEDGGHREPLRCPSCEERFGVPAEKLSGAEADYVVIDPSSLPASCPHCGATVDGGRLEEMVG